jgi:integrase
MALPSRTQTGILERELGDAPISHLDGSVIQRDPAGSHRISEPASSHTSRHSSAAHLMEEAMMILMTQELLGHEYVKATMIHTHVLIAAAWESEARRLPC